MDVEISISLSVSINKLQDLLGDEKTSSNPRLQKEIQTTINNLQLLNQFLKDLEASSSGGSANDPRASQLLKAVYSVEDATDTFLIIMSKEIYLFNKWRKDSCTQKMKFFCSHKMKASYPIRFAKKMKKFNYDVRRLVEIKEAGTSDIENNNDTQLLRFQNDRDHLIRKRQHWGRIISDFCLEDETHVVGLQQQINQLVARLIPQLIRNDGHSGGIEIQDLDVQQHRVESIEVIAVVGEGGSGKTTLATSVYNRIDVKRHFTVRAWVRIPILFKARDVLVDILAQIDQYELVDATLSEYGLMLKLTKVLKGTRFLIVLDDVETLQVWNSLVIALSFPSQGGKIIIIVRSKDYLPENGYSTLNICKLNNEESWKLFSNKVRISEEELNNNSELITLKEQILKICGGLPSTIVLLGGLLSTKEKSFAEWSRVLTMLANSTNEDILALSYQDLPSEVKPCFLHMGLFPKRFEIPVRRLIHLWCAGGFVATTIPEEVDPEDVAEMCMEELVARNMVQVIRWGAEGSPKTCCIMPNVLYDFFSSKAANNVGFRRLAANVEMDNYTRSYVAFNTLVPITPAMAIYEFLRRITSKRGFGLLRVLDLEGVYRPFLPSNQIGRLFLLTYLSLRSTFIDHLPEWVGHMPYLETLDVKHTNIYSVRLPKANKLRHLYLNNIFYHLPYSTILCTLKGVKFEAGIRDRSDMINVFRMTRLTKLGFLSELYPTRTEVEGINQLTQLQSLKLKLYIGCTDQQKRSTCVTFFINLLSFAEHHRLQDLYLLAELPQSVSNVGFLPPNLRKLTLSRSKLKEDPMPVLGKLPHLNILRLLSRSYVGENMACLSIGFPKLYLLKLWELPVRVWTVEEGAMPCLRLLEIRSCDNLELPQGLQNVTALKELVLTNMPTASRAAAEQSLHGEDVYVRNNSWNSDPFPIRVGYELPPPNGVSVFNSRVCYFCKSDRISSNFFHKYQISPCIIVSILIYSTNRRTVLELIPPKWRTLWKEWDLRLAVLISLFIHVLLSILGNRRKYNRKLWIRILVWSAYTAADSVAIFALGIISNNLSDLLQDRCDVGRLEQTIELATVWAQLLFLHMGGPDSITAYALEDNELWLRQLLGLVSQAFGTIYLIFLSRTDEEGSRFSILSIMMFIVGFIKYGERTWVLRAASYQIHRKSVQDEWIDHFNERSTLEDFTLKNKMDKEYKSRSYEGYIVRIDKCPHQVPVSIYFSGLSNDSISDENKFRIVNRFFSATKHLFVDAAISSSYRNTVQTVFRNISLEDAFQVNEIQIGMIYDLRYTKAPLSHSFFGLCLRFVTFFLTCCSLVFFSFFLDHKAKNYSKIDLSITFLLLAVAVVLEISSASALIFSDRFALWLIKHNKDSTFRSLNSFRLVKSPRWSNSMSQYTLICGTRKTKPLLSCGRFLKIGTRKCHEWNTQVTNDLKEMIFWYFKEKSEESAVDGKNPFTALPTTTNTNQEEEQGMSIWEQYEYKMIIWSIATEILYYIDREVNPRYFEENPKLKAIKRISRYMLYLLVKNPSMISAETGLMVVTFEHLTNETDQYYYSHKADECKYLTQKFRDKTHDEDQNRCLMGNAIKLVKELQDTVQNQEERWERIGKTWMEMLGYAARKSKSNNHTQQLRRGGEFITHVWLLMAYFGLTDHFQIPSPSIPHRLISK
ncbi:hypothetical protein Ddye_011317 [Dipteronia dyeriana]|uniref:NB-ARC domain-containing protein n=1 Tax=Dipteronia dyeriana TaxID=168575 RepID=A0AAE0CGR0_9ROSI|nr:hypothetical protein Ddye_011317 [Dipteronia dyeriana]